jgi:hypothetical protein
MQRATTLILIELKTVCNVDVGSYIGCQLHNLNCPCLSIKGVVVV